jgi:hypothetical protein
MVHPDEELICFSIVSLLLFLNFFYFFIFSLILVFLLIFFLLVKFNFYLLDQLFFLKTKQLLFFRRKLLYYLFMCSRFCFYKPLLLIYLVNSGPLRRVFTKHGHKKSFCIISNFNFKLILECSPK